MECYYCGNKLLKEEAVSKKIELWSGGSKPRLIKRNFHPNCLDKFLKENNNKSIKDAESKEWDEVYQYFKNEVLHIKSSNDMPPHAVKRLLGLRVGKYIPNGNNTRIIKRGYSFKTILITLKFCKRAMDKALKTVKFKNNKHKIDYLMVIVASEIDFIQERLDKVERQNRRIEKLKQKEVSKPRNKYVHKGKGMNRFAWVE